MSNLSIDSLNRRACRGLHPLSDYERMNEEVKPLISNVDDPRIRTHLQNALRQIEFALEDSAYANGHLQHLGEYYDQIVQAQTLIKEALKGREIKNIVLVRRSGGWIRRRTEETETGKE